MVDNHTRTSCRSSGEDSIESVQSIKDASPRPSPRPSRSFQEEDVSPRASRLRQDTKGDESPRKQGDESPRKRRVDRNRRRCNTALGLVGVDHSRSGGNSFSPLKDRRSLTDVPRERKEKKIGKCDGERDSKNMEKEIANVLRGGKMKFMELLMSLAEEHESAIATATAALISENATLSGELKRVQVQLVNLQSFMANIAPESNAPPATYSEEDEIAKRKSLISNVSSAKSARFSSHAEVEDTCIEPSNPPQKELEVHIERSETGDRDDLEAVRHDNDKSLAFAAITMPCLPTLLTGSAPPCSFASCPSDPGNDEKSDNASETVHKALAPLVPREPCKENGGIGVQSSPLPLQDLSPGSRTSLFGRFAKRHVNRLSSCPPTASSVEAVGGLSNEIARSRTMAVVSSRPISKIASEESSSPKLASVFSPLLAPRSPLRPTRCTFDDDEEVKPAEEWTMEMHQLWRPQSLVRTNTRSNLDRSSRDHDTGRPVYRTSRSWLQLQNIERVRNNNRFSTLELYTKRFIMRPGSHKRIVWETCGLLLIGYDLVVIPMQTFDLPSSPFYDVMSTFTMAFWAFDIPLSFVTGFHSEGTVELRIEFIARHYARTWLSFDIILISIDLALLLAGLLNESMDDTANSAEYVRFGRTLRFLRLLRLLRLLKVHGVINDIFERVHSEFCLIMFGIARVIVAIMLINHLIACSWYGIGMIYDDDERVDTWIKHNGLQGQSLLYRYSTSVHWSLTQFTPASMEVIPENSLERVFSVCVVVFAMVIFSSLVSSITNAMTQLRNLNSEKLEQLSMLRRYLSENQASVALMGRIWGCLHQVMDKSKRRIHENDVTILKLLPSTLKGDLQEEVYSPIFVEHPFWKQMATTLPAETRRTYQSALEEVSVAIGHEVFNAGDEAGRMMFIFSGILTYLFENSAGPAAMITAGSWAAEAALWIKWKHVGQLAATTHCELVVLRPASLRAAIGEVHEPMKYAMIFADHFKKHPDSLSDIWADQEVLQSLTTKAFTPDEEDEQVVQGHISRTSSNNWLARRRSSVSKFMHALTSKRIFSLREDRDDTDSDDGDSSCASLEESKDESNSTQSRGGSKEKAPGRQSIFRRICGAGKSPLPEEMESPPDSSDEMELDQAEHNVASASFPLGVVPSPHDEIELS